MGIEILCELLISLKQYTEVHTVNVCMIEGTAKRLLSMYTNICNSPQAGYALDLALDATRMHTKVLQFYMGADPSLVPGIFICSILFTNYLARFCDINQLPISRV